MYASIKMLVVVSNQGTIHYIRKEYTYDRDKAQKLLKGCVDKNWDSTAAGAYKTAKSFLSQCSEAGMFYR